MKTPAWLPVWTRFFKAALQACGGVLAFASFLCAPSKADVYVTQNLSLQPGWNAIWVEVDPTNNATGAVFGGIPITAVWSYQPRLASSDYIQDPNEAVWNTANMLMFLPATNPASFQNNLSIIEPNRAYLVKIAGSNSVNLSITGSPNLRYERWSPNAYNLRGLPVDPASPPTFAAYFAFSAVHQGQPIYRLNGLGQWVLANGTDTVQPGAAYWIRSSGDSDYLGPMSISLSQGTSIDLGLDVDNLPIFLNNQTSSGGVFALTDLAAPTLSPFSYSITASNTVSWLQIPSALAVTNSAHQSATFQIAARRADFTSATNQTILKVLTSAGTRFYVGLSAAKQYPGAPPATPQAEAALHAGLWVGTAIVDSVSEANGGVLVTNQVTYPDGSVRPQLQRVGAAVIPTPVRQGSGFNLRLLVHVDTNGVSRLLREVIRMWQDGTTTNDPVTGFQGVATPGHYVLVTDESAIPLFQGSILRDEKQVGKRYSSAFFDFPTPGGNNYITMNGPFAMTAGTNTNAISAMITLSADFPTNPFRHKYHPDHPVGYDITRAVSLEFGPRPDPTADPSSGYDQVAGIYHETVTGLHQTNIVVEGTFTLKRIDTTGVLNQ